MKFQNLDFLLISILPTCIRYEISITDQAQSVFFGIFWWHFIIQTSFNLFGQKISTNKKVIAILLFHSRIVRALQSGPFSRGMVSYRKVNKIPHLCIWALKLCSVVEKALKLVYQYYFAISMTLRGHIGISPQLPPFEVTLKPEIFTQNRVPCYGGLSLLHMHRKADI